jgi:transposase-like protein
MDTTPVTLTRPPGTSRQRRYTDEEAAQTLVLLAENGGNVAKTARDTGIPEQTIRHWRDGTIYVPPPEVVEQMKLARAAGWDVVQADAVAQTLEKLPEASAYQAALIGAIAVDKAALLRGEATVIHSTADDERQARLRELYAARRKPIVVQPIETGPETTQPPADPPEAGAAEG